ncbi:MAG: ATP-binding cassette domain-containing protein [Porticoccaceae bacterium]|nr:ATP-binding cassette domain-containing protein [Porticoccaceae bacterium]
MSPSTESTTQTADQPGQYPDGVIITKNLSRAYGDKMVLRDVNLSIRESEIFGLLGPDGAGKTTLMQVMAAILDPTEGSCTIMDHDSVKDAYWVNSHIGYMFQGFALYDKLSIEENMKFSADIRGLSQDLFLARQERLLKMAGLYTFLSRPAGNLSGGMRKKLSLCTNLIHEPRLLLLDELSLGVDPASRKELWDMLHESRDDGVSIVVSTPYMDEAEHCDRLAFLHEGEVLAIDTPSNLHSRCTGHVYELSTDDRGAAHNALVAHKDTLSIRHLAEHVHFQLHTENYIAPELEATLKQNKGVIEAVESSLDDAYTMLSGGEKSSAYAERPPKIHLPERLPEGGLIRTEGMTIRFGDFVANDHVTLEIRPGEVFGFLGANGAGKTTFIRALCGLQSITEGNAWIGGISVRDEHRKLRNHIGYMSQRFSLYPDLTVAENLSFFGGVYGLSRSDKKKAIDWAVGVTDLGDVKNNLVADMSGALNQRLALACAIMHEPAVVFLDEPTSGVSPAARYKFWQLIQTLAEVGTTIFVTTHYMEEANYCHRLGMMHQGRLIGVGKAGQLIQELPQEYEAKNIEDMFLAYIKIEDQRIDDERVV